jgi:hypothetical protein
MKDTNLQTWISTIYKKNTNIYLLIPTTKKPCHDLFPPYIYSICAYLHHHILDINITRFLATNNKLEKKTWLCLQHFKNCSHNVLKSPLPSFFMSAKIKIQGSPSINSFSQRIKSPNPKIV